MKTLLRLFPAYFLIAVVIATPSAFAQTKLLRFPDIHGEKVVFIYGGDLWTASTSGGVATRLTAHPGVQVFAKFSPEGKWIAFTGQYDGDEQVYVIPSSGGEPRQLTFYPARGPLTPRWATTIRSTAGRPTARPCSSARSAIRGRCQSRSSTPSPWPAGPPRRCRCRNRARAITRRTE